MSERRHSFSSLQTLMKCERAYVVRYIEELEKDAPEKVMFLRGTAWHAVITADLLQRGAAAGSLQNFPESIKITGDVNLNVEWSGEEGGHRVPWVKNLVEGGGLLPFTPYAVIEHIRAWEQAQESDRKDEIVADLGAPLHERLLDLWIRHQEKWAEVDARQLPLLVEYEWARQAPNGMTLQGRLDAVVYDQDNCLVIVRDTKTHDSWPSEPDAVLDLMGSQLHLQAWGVAPALRNLTDGTLVPQAVEFDRVRIKKPTTPKLTTKGILSKSVTDFDRYTYTEWCKLPEVIEAGYVFEESVAEKAAADPNAWFRRSLKPLSMQAVTAHVKAAQAQAVRAENLVASEAGIVPSKECAWCPYLSLCRAEIIGGRPEKLIPQDYNLRVIRKD
jgi:hypothetical protein